MGSGAIIYIYTKIYKDWFRHPKVDKEETQTHREIAR
jgi:hypothetical protein